MNETQSNLLWILCLLFGLILSITILGLMSQRLKDQRVILDSLKSTLKDRDKTIHNLLNRLQSGDLRTFHSLVSNSDDGAPETPTYQLRSDAAELEIISKAQGLGESIYDDGTTDEFNETLSELVGGFEIEPRGTREA